MAHGTSVANHFAGMITHAYPLISRPSRDASRSVEWEGMVANDFSLGTGPCGCEAVEVVAWELRLATSITTTCYVFLYDRWARQVGNFKRRVRAAGWILMQQQMVQDSLSLTVNSRIVQYKVDVGGLGVAALDHWDVGHDTEDMKLCYVIAERHILTKTLERSPRLFSMPSGVTIRISYEEPQIIPDSDQLVYAAPREINSRDFQQLDAKQTPPTTKANPRGKRTLREIAATTANPELLSSYKYTPLAELGPGNANVYGVVVNMSMPQVSERKGNYYMSVHLIDESYPAREDAIQFMVFAPTLDKLPKIKYVGDVIRFHKVLIHRYNDRLQGAASIARFCRYLVLRELSNGQLEEQYCTETRTFEDYDRDRVMKLIRWTKQTLPLDITLPPGCPEAPKLLQNIVHDECFADVVVRVLHVQMPYDALAARLIVWDGSGDKSQCEELYSKLLREAVRFVPDRGMLMEVLVDSCWVLLEELSFVSELCDHWCRFRNVSVSREISANEANPTTWFELHFREKSALMFVPDYLRSVQMRLQVGQGATPALTPPTALLQPEQQPSSAPSRVINKPLDVTTQIPQTIVKKVPITSLAVVRNSTALPYRYHCRGVVTKFWPQQVEQLVRPQGDRFVYFFTIELQDDTSALPVIVHGSDAEMFLPGIPPCDLSTNTASKQQLERRLTSLVETRQPMDWCIKAYAVQSKETSQPQVRFRLFNTVLLSH